MSSNSAGKQPPEGPPICTALNLPLSLIPPPISKMISRSVIPIGTSTKPLLFIFPVKAKTFVPLLFSVPIELNLSAPFKIIQGTLAKVSTLFMHVGLPQSPDTAGKGGRTRGIPRLPSIEAIRAVSSPQTKAPAPCLMSISKLKEPPKSFWPRNPFL